MKRIFIILFTISLIFRANAQNGDSAKIYVQQGIALHDNGDYEAALKKYDQALSIDKNNFSANYEKSYTLYILKKYDESISISKFMLDSLPENDDDILVYCNYGSCFDDKGDPDNAIKIYDKGIKKYPGSYLLYFNKGLTLQRTDRIDDALICYQKTLILRPLHPSANYYTGALLQKSNKVPALLSTLLFLVIEPQTERSVYAFERVQKILYGNITKDSNNHTTISISSDLLKGAGKKNKRENDFSNVEFMMSLLVTSTNDTAFAKSDDADKLDFQLQLLAGSLKENMKDAKGFYWKFYVPFFVELKEKNYTNTLAHIVYATAKDDKTEKWLTDNKDKIDEFYVWLKNYSWPAD